MVTPEELGFSDEGSIQFSNRIDPSDDPTRDNVVVDPSSGSLTFSLPLPYRIRGRSADIQPRLFFQSSRHTPKGKFGNFFYGSWQKLLVIEFSDQLTCETGPKTANLRAWINSVPRITEIDGEHGTRLWTNRDAIYPKYAFENQPPVGVPSGALAGVGEIIPPTGVAPNLIYAVIPPQEDCIGIPKQARNLGPQKIGDTTKGFERSGWSEFVPPLGVFDSMLISCGTVEIRRADGRVDSFSQFHNYAEHTYIDGPVDPLDPTPNAVRVQVICLPTRTTFPNGDTIRYHYDGEGRLWKIIDNYGRKAMVFEYDEVLPNRIVSISDYLGRTTTFGYSGDLLASVNYLMSPSRTWQFLYTTHTVQAPDVEVRSEMATITLIDQFQVRAPGDPPTRPYIDASFDTSNFAPPISAYVETGRVTELKLGGFAEGAKDSIDLDGNGTVDYQVPQAGKQSSYEYAIGWCFENSIVTIEDSLSLTRTHTFDWQGREISREDEGPGLPVQGIVTSFEYHGLYPTVWKTTSPKGHVTEQTFQFMADDDDPAGIRSYFTYPEVIGESGKNRDRFQGGNRLRLTRYPSADDPLLPDSLVEQWTYEPYLNQVRTATDSLGWVSTRVYDYQEGTLSQAFYDYLTKWGIQLGSLPLGLPDQNGDGNVDQEFGLAVRLEHPVVTLGDLTRAENGGFDQVAVETTAYNEAGQVLWSLDPAGRYTAYDYYPENDPDGDGVLVDPAAPPGSALGYLKTRVDDADPFENQTDPLQLVTEFGYTPLGDVTWTRNPRGFHEVSLFNSYQLVIAQFAGDVTTNGTPVDPGVTPYTQVFYDYDLRNRRVMTRELNTEPSTANRGVHLGEVTTYLGYDLMDNVRIVSSELLDPLSNDGWMTTFYHYDGNGNVIEEVSPEGRAKSYVYDAKGRVTSKRVHVNWDTTPANGTDLTLYDESDPLLSFEYDLNSNKEKLTITGSTRDVAYRLLFDVYDRKQALQALDAATEEALLSTEQEHDANGNITAVRRRGPRDGGETAQELLSEELYFYDERDRLFLVEKSYFQWTKDGAGAWQRLDFGATGKTVSETAYDARSLAIATKDDLGRVTRIHYDGVGREIDRELPLVQSQGQTLVNRKVLDLDGNGNVISEQLFEVGRDDTGAQVVEQFLTAFEYDALDRKVTETREPGLGAEAIVTRWEYTSLGDLRGSWNPNGIGTRHMFDTQRRDVLTRMGHAATDLELDDAEGVIVGPENVDGYILALREYDLDGNLLFQTDDKGNVTATDFDAAGRRKSLIYADTSKEDFTYHREGTLLDEKRFDKNGALLSTITYAYDAVLRKTQADFQNELTSGLSGVFRETFQYDGLSRVTRGVAEAKVPNHSNWTITSTIVKEYDSLGLVRKDDQGFLLVRPSGNDTYADVVTCVYDGVGNCTRVSTPSGYEVDYEFDELNRIRRVLQGANELNSYEYLGSSFRLREQTSGNGTKLVIGTSRYDAFRRVTGMRYVDTGENLQTEFTYAYDKVGNQLEEVKLHDSTTSKKFVYDDGNRLSEYRVGSPPFATSTLVESFGLDGVGNWIDHNGNENSVNAVHEYQAQFDQATPVAYDGRGNLKQYGSTTYTYDDKGRIVASTIGAQEYYYAFDVEGRRVLAEVNFFTHAGLREIRQVKATAQTTIVQEYVYGNGLDELLSFVKAGNRYYIQRNRQGSTVALTNASGVVAERYDYSPFGVVSGGGSVNCRYLFAGRREDEKSGLYFLRARYYLAEMGRFTSRDQIGVWGDADNVGNGYVYCANSPAVYCDPSGNDGGLGPFTAAPYSPPQHTQEEIKRWQEDIIRSDRELLEKVLLGDFSKGETSQSSTIGNVVIGLTPAGIVADVRDTVANIIEGDFVGTLLSAVGALPLVGDLARIGGDAARAGDDVADALRTGGKVSDSASASKAEKYSSIPDPKNVGEGKDFTPATKRQILEQNKAENGGTIRSDQSGAEAVPSQKSQRGVSPPSNEAQIDHVVPKSKGGTNSPSNAQVLTRDENRAKGDK